VVIKPCVGFVDQFAFGLRSGAGVAAASAGLRTTISRARVPSLRTNGYNPVETSVMLAGGGA
jgi:hypothetical protein